jgi:hypothetical protein
MLTAVLSPSCWVCDDPPVPNVTSYELFTYVYWLQLLIVISPIVPQATCSQESNLRAQSW